MSRDFASSVSSKNTGKCEYANYTPNTSASKKSTSSIDIAKAKSNKLASENTTHIGPAPPFFSALQHIWLFVITTSLHLSSRFNPLEFSLPHPLHISRVLSQVSPREILEIKKLGRDKVLAQMNSYEAANRLVSNNILSSYNLKTFISSHRVLCSDIKTSL